jgi:biotin carboxyl carrier protein
VKIEQSGERYVVHVDGQVFELSANLRDRGRIDLEIEGRRLRTYAVQNGERVYVAVEGQTWVLRHPDPPRSRRIDSVAGGGSLRAAMPGRVLDVCVAEGDLVAKGDTLVLLEAMKMELRITAPADGQVARIHCMAGQVVERDAVLLELS